MSLVVPKRLHGPSAAHARSRTQEKAAATRLGGRTTNGSGSGFERGDVRVKGVLRLECKTTKHSSFSITEEIVRKLEAAVVGTGEIPVIQVELALGRTKLILMPDYALDMFLAR